MCRSGRLRHAAARRRSKAAALPFDGSGKRGGCLGEGHRVSPLFAVFTGVYIVKCSIIGYNGWTEYPAGRRMGFPGRRWMRQRRRKKE